MPAWLLFLAIFAAGFVVGMTFENKRQPCDCAGG